MKKDFEIVRDSDGIIIYDESDDYCEDEVDDEEMVLATSHNALFTAEELREFREKKFAEEAREKRLQRWISVGVILGCILFTALVSLYSYWMYMV